MLGPFTSALHTLVQPIGDTLGDNLLLLAYIPAYGYGLYNYYFRRR